MIFQTLDDKKHCTGYYAGGKIHYDEAPPGLSKTWGFSPHIQDHEVQYARVYCGGKTLDEVCPEDLRERWTNISMRMRSFLRSFSEAQVSLEEHCFYELVPERYLMEFCEIKNQICEHVFETYEKPDNYDFTVSLGRVLSDIEMRPLNLKLGNLRDSLSKPYVRTFWKKFRGSEQYVKYNLFGTKTGRLTTQKTSFPIHNMSKEFRCVIEPRNDYFVELDFNAAELRTLLALSSNKQPSEDLHDWNIQNVFRNLVTRDEAKTRIFAWLYNPESEDYLANRAYDRESVVQKYFNGEQVTTFFNRKIPSDSHHALNYIIQSTTSDTLLRRMVAVFDKLKEMESFISFCIHDNLVLDMKKQDCYIIPELVDIFSNTELGKFKTNMRVGRNFGAMKEIDKWT